MYFEESIIKRFDPNLEILKEFPDASTKVFQVEKNNQQYILKMAKKGFNWEYLHLKK